ncbi:hypothetical protein [Hyalangium rubrum]|uniref:Lipoprotein n=1 Tax=Hyalangium rubrum TaxID=3103134 RepID=A0ABU5H8P7_9BACT|nr:hypothetical protein [Hyalangium sp. s54d21]MDY7229863.1 hypothetical protein [Hyalangium sp. s54d21]
MMTRQRILWSVCASSVLLLATACGKDEESQCGEPLYGGSASDETWMTMTDALKKEMDSSKAVTVTSPAEWEAFAADAPPPLFSWTSPLRASLERDTQSRYAQARPRVSRGVLAWLGELLVPTAEAHLPPYTGDIYLVEVGVANRQCPLQVLTTELSWQVDEASWRLMGEGGGQDLSLRVTSAYMQDNRLKEGPYRMVATRTFRREGAKP